MGLKKVEAHWEKNRKRWRVNGQRDGERRTFYSFTPGLRGKKEAERKADSWKKGVLHENSDPSVAELWECFLRYLGQEVQAYYLFGLGLRQEVLWALGLE